MLRRGEVFGWLDELKREGKITAIGVPAKSNRWTKPDICLRHGGVASLQIIFNIFRQKPVHTLFAAARAKGVALIVRLPLASGLLGGHLTRQSTFSASDHRVYNRDGQKFNVGETFAGLPFEKGVELAEALQPLVPAGWTMADFALRWCLDFEAVSVLIPGAQESGTSPGQLPRLRAPSARRRASHVKLAAFLRAIRRRVQIRGPY